MKQYKILVGLSAAMVSFLPVFSQNMNNPYSVYGIGDIDHRVYDRTNGMAGTGLAIKSDVYLVDNNPASIIGLPRGGFVANAGITGRASSFSGDPINGSNSKNKDLWIKRFAVAAKVNKFWAASAGFSQFSNINYKFSGSKFIEGTTTVYNTSYEGDGGLNEYHFTNAFSIGKHFSAGIKSSIIAGSINQSETLIDDGLQSAITTTQQDYIGDFRFQGGFIYEKALNKKWDLSIGGRFSPRTVFGAERTLIVTENGEKIAEDTYMKKDRFYLPTTFAGGIALKGDKSKTYAVDYTYEDWSSLHVTERSWQLINSHKVSAGAQFSRFKLVKTPVGNVIVEKFLQFGAFFHNSYLQVRNQPISEYGFTVGKGGLLGKIDQFGSSMRYTIALDGGIRGTKKAGLIRETYIGLTFTVSYVSVLFGKGKKYD